MKTPENIFLVGPMGAGKTTVGRHLAKSLHKHFLDCDGELEARTGASVMLIFELEGESGFRTREQALLDQLSQRKGIDSLVLKLGVRVRPGGGLAGCRRPPVRLRLIAVPPQDLTPLATP